MSTVKVAIDSLSVMSKDNLTIVLKSTVDTSTSSWTPEWLIPTIICGGIAFSLVIVWLIINQLVSGKKQKYAHELDLKNAEYDEAGKKRQHESELKGNEIKKEVNKQLLDFCYKLVESDNNEAKENVKKITTDKTKTIQSGNVVEDKTVEKEECTKIESASDACTSSTFTLDQIRQQCWQIIKDLNDIKI